MSEPQCDLLHSHDGPEGSCAAMVRLTQLTELRDRIAAALALADAWTAIHGHDQRAATHHALADDLREVLGGGV